MSDGVVASLAITGHSIFGVRRIALTRATRRLISVLVECPAAIAATSYAGVTGGDPPAVSPGPAALTAPQFPHTFVPSGIASPHVAQNMFVSSVSPGGAG